MFRRILGELFHGLSWISMLPIRWFMSAYPRPRYLAFITVVTLGYLVVELAFNARLLDVVGGMPTSGEVDSIEKYGRFISGAALTIAAWGLVVLPHSARQRWLMTKTLIWLLVTGLVCISAAYYGERKLIDTIVDQSTAQQRYVAANLKLLATALVTNNVEIEKISLTRAQFASPEGKTFLALFPFLTFAVEDVDQKIKTKKADLIRNIVSDRIGGLHATYNRYIDSNVEIKKLYNHEYLRGTDQYLAVLRSIPDRQKQAWKDYERDLRQKRFTPENIPGKYWDRVRNGVRGKGLNVPVNWNPNDQHAFYVAVAEKTAKQAEARFNEELAKRFEGSSQVKPNLPFLGFASSPAVQERWRRSLYFPPGVTLRPDIPSPGVFSREVYEPVMRELTREQMRKYDAPVDAFANGHRLEKFGKDGMRAIVVPPIALGFSILGALVHVFKLGNYLIFLISARRNAGRLLMGGMVVGVSVYVMATPNAVVVQPIYPVLHRQTAEQFGEPVAVIAKWVIQAQSFAYPANEWVRLRVLSGAKFGYYQNNTVIIDNNI